MKRRSGSSFAEARRDVHGQKQQKEGSAAHDTAVSRWNKKSNARDRLHTPCRNEKGNRCDGLPWAANRTSHFLVHLPQQHRHGTNNAGADIILLIPVTDTDTIISYAESHKRQSNHWPGIIHMLYVTKHDSYSSTIKTGHSEFPRRL